MPPFDAKLHRLCKQYFAAPEGRKVGSLKRRVRSQLARWEMKNCTPLWREAHLQAKKLKTPHVRNTFGSWAVEKVHAVVAWSTFGSQDVQNTRFSDHICVSKSKCTKHLSLGALLEVEMFKKCTPLWREAHFEVKMHKTPHVRRATFGRWSVVLCGGRNGFCTLPKVSKTWRFCSTSKNDGRRGTFEEDLQRWISRGRRSTRDIFIRDVRRSGRWFLERDCMLEHPIFRFAKMILRDSRSTLYDLASLFRGRRNTLDTWTRKIAKRIGTRPSALHSAVHSCTQLSILEGKSRRIALFLMLSAWKLKKSRRIASLLMLSALKIEEVSQNSFVFKLADRQTDR